MYLNFKLKLNGRNSNHFQRNLTYVEIISNAYKQSYFATKIAV